MRTRLDHLPAVQDDDAVGRLRGLQPVRDDHRRAALRNLLHRGRNVRLGHEVEVRGGLVEQQQHRVDQLGPGERDELALT